MPDEGVADFYFPAFNRGVVTHSAAMSFRDRPALAKPRRSPALDAVGRKPEILRAANTARASAVEFWVSVYRELRRACSNRCLCLCAITGPLGPFTYIGWEARDCASYRQYRTILRMAEGQERFSDLPSASVLYDLASD